MTKTPTKHQQTQSGMALTTVLVFSAVAIIIITLGITLTVIQASSSRQFIAAEQALTLAEAGMENALIRLIRDPNYSGETLTLTAGTATITVVADGTNRIVTVVGENATASRHLQAIVAEENGSSVLTSWQEI